MGNDHSRHSSTTSGSDGTPRSRSWRHGTTKSREPIALSYSGPRPGLRSEGSARALSASVGFSTDANEPNLTWMNGRVYQNMKGSTYFLPRDAEELERIQTQHFILKSLFDGNYLSPVRQALESPGRILDVGCGPATWLMEMAIEFPHCSCVGFDCADVFPMYSKPENVDFKLGNVLEGLPFEDESFDLVNMRCMCVALRKSEWRRVMAELYRVTKKGGLVQLTELDMEFVSKDEVASAFLERISLTLAGRGQDPTVATHLHRLIRGVGYSCIARERRSIPLGWNGSLGDLMLEASRQAFIGSAPLFATVFALSREDYILQVDDVLDRLRESKSYLNWYTALGRKES